MRNLKFEIISIVKVKFYREKHETELNKNVFHLYDAYYFDHKKVKAKTFKLIIS